MGKELQAAGQSEEEPGRMGCAGWYPETRPRQRPVRLGGAGMDHGLGLFLVCGSILGVQKKGEQLRKGSRRD